MNIDKNKKVILIFIILTILLCIILLFLKFNIFIDKIDKKEENIKKESIKEKKYVVPYNEPPTITNIVPVTIDKCKGEKDEKSEKECFNQLNLQTAVFNRNLKSCVLIDDLDKRDDCIFLIAKQRVDEEDVDIICHRIVNSLLKAKCFSSVSVFKSNDLENKVCENFQDEPFMMRICEDKTLAYRARRAAKLAKTEQERIKAVAMCRENMKLEYQVRCFQWTLLEINYDCNLLEDGWGKDFCKSEKIFIQYNERTVNDCKSMPLEAHRKVCLKEIETGIDKNKADSDKDGASDGEELFFNIDPFNPDTDGDGLLDGDEIHKYGSNPADSDTDGDGLSDFREIEMDTNFHNPDSDGNGLIDSKDNNPLDGLNDSDGDRLSDSEEEKWGTDPNKKDTDGDGKSDGAEIILYGTNPLGKGWQHDTDGDGLIDVDEVFYRTNRLKPDTDGDGINDGDEVRNLTNPLGTGDMDFDGDGLSDKDEEKHGTNPSKKDTNDDGVDDLEAIQKGIEAISNDTDGDGLNNLYEINKLKTDPLKADTDNDGLIDKEEISQYFTDPNNPDTDGDGYSDGDEVKSGYNPNGEGKL